MSTTIVSLAGAVRLPIADSFEKVPRPLAWSWKLIPRVLKFSVWVPLASVSATAMVWVPPGPVRVICPSAPDVNVYVPAAAVGAARFATVALVPLATNVKSDWLTSHARPPPPAMTGVPPCLYASVIVWKVMLPVSTAVEDAPAETGARSPVNVSPSYATEM